MLSTTSRWPAAATPQLLVLTLALALAAAGACRSGERQAPKSDAAGAAGAAAKATDAGAARTADAVTAKAADGGAAPRHCPGVFHGKWKTPIGWVHIHQTGDRTVGKYARGGFTGKVTGNRMDATFKYIGMTGTITYVMAPDGKTATATYKTSLGQKGSYVAVCHGPPGSPETDEDE